MSLRVHWKARPLKVGRVVFTFPTSPASLPAGGTLQLAWQVLSYPQDDDEIVLTGRVVTFESSHPSIATVDSAGLVTQVSTGSCTITARCEGKSTVSPTITVSAAIPHNIVVAPSAATIEVGDDQVFAATVRDSSNNPLSGQTVTWSSSDPTKVSIGDDSGDENHQAIAHGEATGGSPTIRAHCGVIQSSPSPVTVVTPGGTLYWSDDQSSGGFGPGSGGFGWGASGGTAPAPDVTADPNSPTGFSVRFRFGWSRTLDAYSATAWAEKRFHFGAQMTEIFIGWNRWLPLVYYHRNGPSSDNNKVLRVWGNAYDVNEGDVGIKSGFSAYPSPSTGGNSFFNLSGETIGRSASDGGVSTTWSPTGVMGVLLSTDLGVWRRYVFHVKRATAPNANDGVVELWIDGVLKWSKSNANLWDYSPVKHNYFNRGYFEGASNSGWNVETPIRIQGVKFASTYSLAA